MAADAPIRAVVFDLDGTLVDSTRDIAVATNHVLEASGRAPLAEDEIRSYVGDGARSLLARAARLEESAEELGPLLAEFLDFYTAHAVDHTQPLPGVLGALERLSVGLPLAVCTNKPRRTTEAVLRALALDRFFGAVSCGDDGGEKKPAPAPLYKLASELGVPAESLVMVGDGAQDVLSGRAAGARTVGVRGGIQAPERMLAARPDAVIDSLAELPDLLGRWAQATSR